MLVLDEVHTGLLRHSAPITNSMTHRVDDHRARPDTIGSPAAERPAGRRSAAGVGRISDLVRRAQVNRVCGRSAVAPVRHLDVMPQESVGECG